MSVVDLYVAAHETELNEKIEAIHKTQWEKIREFHGKSYDYHMKIIKGIMKKKNDE